MSQLPDLSDGRVGLIPYPSANPFEIHHILCKLDEAPAQELFGWLLMPETATGPVPCIVACHGSLGWRGHHHEHMVRWLEAGIAVFRVHSFEARNVTSIVEDQMAVTHAMLLTDAYRALEMLGSHPGIEAARIGVTGWSLGGTVSLYAAWEPIAEALAPNGERFAAHLPLYPAAHLRPEEPRWTGAPIRVLHGADDDYTPVRFVDELAEELRSHGIPIEVIAYEGGHHSFDSIEPLTWLPDAVRLGRSTTTIDRLHRGQERGRAHRGELGGQALGVQGRCALLHRAPGRHLGARAGRLVSPRRARKCPFPEPPRGSSETPIEQKTAHRNPESLLELPPIGEDRERRAPRSPQDLRSGRL
jgi:dienelactone hydrolase